LFGGAISPTVAGFLAHWDLRGIYYLDSAIFVALALALLPSVSTATLPRVSPASRPPDA
jgi:hypothetical protein